MLNNDRNVQLPQYLLPDLATAALYLEQPVLRQVITPAISTSSLISRISLTEFLRFQRLLEISAVATAQLQSGVAPSELFGRQHKHDAPRFHETMRAHTSNPRHNLGPRDVD